MMTYVKSAIRPTQLFYWVACILGTALALLYLAFLLGAGRPPLSWGSVSLFVMTLGFLFAWWNGMLGAVLGVIGISGFYLWNLAHAGNLPGGWVFPLCFIAAGLHIVAQLLKRSERIAIVTARRERRSL